MATPKTLKDSGREQSIIAYFCKELAKLGYSAEEIDEMLQGYFTFLATPPGESDLDKLVEMMLEQLGKDKNIFSISITTLMSFELIAEKLIESGRLSGENKEIIRDCKFIDRVPDNQEGTIRIELIQVVPEGRVFSHQKVLDEIGRREEYVGLATSTQGLSILSQNLDLLEDIRQQDEHGVINVVLLGETFNPLKGVTSVVVIHGNNELGYMLDSHQVHYSEDPGFHDYHLFPVVLKEEQQP